MIVQLSERPVRIAVSTTVDIVSKDFALEPDEVKMRSAAHKMVSGLISSYAVVSCQELLESSLIANLREAFVPQNYTQVSSCVQCRNLFCYINLIDIFLAHRLYPSV